MALVEICNVKKNYYLGKTVIPAVRGISFSIRKGEFIVLMGPSGCGKTTLLNLVGCIDTPSAGDISIDGRQTAVLDDNGKAELRLSRIGFIFQSFNLVPVLTVAENIEFPLVLAGAAAEKRKNRVAELIGLVGLTGYSAHHPDELSGGQRQRVSIARALVNNPGIILADEPTANLDSETGTIIMNELQSLNRRSEITFLVSTHNPDLIRYATRVIKLKDGQLVSDQETDRCL
jgi:putative ABC transport system ATP-binding protein